MVEQISVQQFLDVCGGEKLTNGEEALGPTLVLTPNNRLSRFVHRQYDKAALSKGKKAWAPVSCWSLQLWLTQQWQYFSLQYPEQGGKHLLTPSEALLLWQEVINNSESAEALFNTQAAAEVALRAWNTLAQWRINEGTAAWTQIAEESPAFVEWAAQFQQKCAQHNFIDENIMMRYLADAISSNTLKRFQLPRRIILLSFDAISPLFESLIDALKSAGVEVDRYSLCVDGAMASSVGIVDARHELQTAAQWARDRLAENDQRQIGIVIPDLSQRRVEVESVFYRVFEPQYILPEHPRHAPPFNISASVTLSSTPPIAAALLVLQCNRHSIAIEDAVALLHSPFIGKRKDLSLRAMLSEHLEAEHIALSVTSLRVRIGEYLKLENTDAPLQELHDNFVEFSSVIRDAEKTRSPSAWSESFAKQLCVLGWPGERSLDTLEFQQIEHWKRALEQFAQLDHVMPNISLNKALDCLNRIVKDTAFQAKTDYSPIQILGLLEASGLVFDELWVMGLDDENWPPKIQPNPLIPLALQRQHNMPRASVEKELTLAQDITARFSRSASKVIFSYPQQSGDKHLSPSALLSKFPRIEQTEFNIQQNQTYAEQLLNSVNLESILDDSANTLLNVDNIRGGAQILQDQAACPFKAFATHRLLTKAKERAAPGYSPQDRGSLVHVSLELIWKSLQKSENLNAMPDSALQALVEDSIETCFRELFSREGHSLKDSHGNMRGSVLTALEKQRMVALLMNWLQLEKGRTPFDVVLNEGRQAINVNGLPINLRFDRIDKLADGGYVILDYKTGVKSLSSWEGNRPDDPQVPLYSVAFNRRSDNEVNNDCVGESITNNSSSNLSAVAFAQINIEDMAFKGLGESSDLIKGIKTPQELKRNNFSEDWSEVLSNWQLSLEKLANEFLEGRAPVDPKRGQVSCQYCHLKSLCRVKSRMNVTANTAGATEGELEGDTND